MDPSTHHRVQTVQPSVNAACSSVPDSDSVPLRGREYKQAGHNQIPM